MSCSLILNSGIYPVGGFKDVCDYPNVYSYLSSFEYRSSELTLLVKDKSQEGGTVFLVSSFNSDYPISFGNSQFSIVYDPNTFNLLEGGDNGKLIASNSSLTGYYESTSQNFEYLVIKGYYQKPICLTYTNSSPGEESSYTFEFYPIYDFSSNLIRYSTSDNTESITGEPGNWLWDSDLGSYTNSNTDPTGSWLTGSISITVVSVNGICPQV